MYVGTCIRARNVYDWNFAFERFAIEKVAFEKLAIKSVRLKKLKVLHFTLLLMGII